MCLCDKTNESDKYPFMKWNLHFLLIFNITNATTAIFSCCILWSNPCYVALQIITDIILKGHETGWEIINVLIRNRDIVSQYTH